MANKVKKFKDFSNVKKYFEIGDFESTIEVNSPTYGKYRMTQTMKINLLSALDDGNLKDAYDLYSKVYDIIRGSTTKTLEQREFGRTRISNFIFYTPFKCDNKDWFDPNGVYDVGYLPVGYDKQTIYNKLKSLIL
jgi:hypothetical protein